MVLLKPLQTSTEVLCYTVAYVGQITESEESVNADLCQSFSDLAAIIFLPPSPVWKCKHVIVMVPPYTLTHLLQLQVRTNQKDRKLIGKRHRAMPMFPISLFGSGTSQAGILLPVTTIPKPLLQSKDGPCSGDINRWSIRELYFHKQKYLQLPALLQKHGSFRTG